MSVSDHKLLSDQKSLFEKTKQKQNKNKNKTKNQNKTKNPNLGYVNASAKIF